MNVCLEASPPPYDKLGSPRESHSQNDTNFGIFRMLTILQLLCNTDYKSTNLQSVIDFLNFNKVERII